MNLFSELNEKEVQELKLWARENYILGTKVNEMYHPVVQQECDLMNREEAYKVRQRVDIEHLVSELCDVVLNFDYEPLVHEGRTTNSEENQMIHNEIKQTLFNHGIHGCVYDDEYLKSKVQP